MSSKTKNKIEYNYYVDTTGLYYESTRSGKPYECFDVNGVISINEYPDMNILYLCYVNPKDENDKS